MADCEQWRRQRNHICHDYPDTANIWATQEATEAMKAITAVGRGIQTLRAGIFPTAYNDLEDLMKVC